jgi:acyl dehydratase
MASEELKVPEALLQYVGQVDPPTIKEVEKGAIRRYAAAVGDPNPLYSDDEYARKSRYGGIIAPPGFFGWPKAGLPAAEGLIGLMTGLIEAGYAGILDGGMAYECYLPVRAGDTLVASPMVKDVTAKAGKTNMMITRFETTYLNQNGDLVARSFHTLIGRKL